MAIYKLEESEDVYIAPRFYSNKFQYHMTRIASEISRNNIRTIDLRSDKLMVYGTEIKQSTFDRLHESLVLRPKVGIVFVNCNGACYIHIPGKGCHRPIQNTIFDWSHFGVIVPNSTLDSLRMQPGGNKKDVDEIKELKKQLSTSQMEKQELEAKLRKVCDQLSSIDHFDLESHKVELESSNKEIKELRDQLSKSRKEIENIEEELQKVRSQLSSTNFEFQSMATQLEVSKRRMIELEEQLSMSKKENEDGNLTLQKVQEQVSTSNFELESANKQLEISNIRVKELEHEVSSCKKENIDLEQELFKVQDEVSIVKIELGLTNAHLESSKKRVDDLEEKLSNCEDECQITKLEMQRVQDHLSLANDELQSSKNKLETYEKQVQELKDQSFASKKEIELWKVIDQFRMFDSEVKSTNKKLDQLLISIMWNELDHPRNSHHSQPRSSPLILETRQRRTNDGNSIDNSAISIKVE